ncbi:DUF1330 domain-containing protein [Krasilnikovia sp. M28-CT-15]|uniref:DUF1330 domain-containing protein n=1 Tax=Krasilnikovia sp. M28-CT-15 TaxID=3373540 RepID=UPI0038777DA2
MTVYVIAQLSIHDRERYDRYAAGVASLLPQFGGRLLVSDEDPRVAEGQWDGDKVVVLSFPDQDALTAWGSSPEYQRIVQDRHAATDGVVLTVRGAA